MTYLQILRRPATFSKLLLPCEADSPQNTPRKKKEKRKSKEEQAKDRKEDTRVPKQT
jgi:hypothetical protein